MLRRDPHCWQRCNGKLHWNYIRSFAVHILGSDSARRGKCLLNITFLFNSSLCVSYPNDIDDFCWFALTNYDLLIAKIEFDRFFPRKWLFTAPSTWTFSQMLFQRSRATKPHHMYNMYVRVEPQINVFQLWVLSGFKLKLETILGNCSNWNENIQCEITRMQAIRERQY